MVGRTIFYFTKITFRNAKKHKMLKAHFIYFIDNEHLGGRTLGNFPFTFFSMKLYSMLYNNQRETSFTEIERL